MVDVAEWDEPQAGMFLWVKVKEIKDSFKLLMDLAKQHQVENIFLLSK